MIALEGNRADLQRLPTPHETVSVALKNGTSPEVTFQQSLKGATERSLKYICK